MKCAGNQSAYDRFDVAVSARKRGVGGESRLSQSVLMLDGTGGTVGMIGSCLCLESEHGTSERGDREAKSAGLEARSSVLAVGRVAAVVVRAVAAVASVAAIAAVAAVAAVGAIGAIATVGAVGTVSAVVLTVGVLASVADDASRRLASAGVRSVLVSGSVGVRAVLGLGDVVALRRDRVGASDRARDVACVLLVHGVLGRLLRLVSTGLVDLVGGKDGVDAVDDTVGCDNVGLDDLGALAINSDGAGIIVELEILAASGDQAALVDEERRVDDTRLDNMLAEDGRQVSLVGVGGGKLLKRLVGRGKDGHTGSRVELVDERAVLNTAELLHEAVVLEVRERGRHVTGHGDSVRDRLDSKALVVDSLADKGTVVDGLGDNVVVGRLGQRHGLAGTSGQVDKAGRGEGRVANRVERVGVQLVKVELALENVLQEGSLEDGVVAGDPLGESLDGVVGGGQDELARVVSKQGLRDGLVLADDISEAGQVGATEGVKESSSISVLTGLERCGNGTRNKSGHSGDRNGGELHLAVGGVSK